MRAQAQQATIFALLKSGVPTAGASAAWQALTEAAARTLQVAHASVWLLSDDGMRLLFYCAPETERIVLVDAVDLGLAPGEWRLFEPAAVETDPVLAP